MNKQFCAACNKHIPICELHSAAPALLEALETAYSVIMDGRPDSWIPHYIVEARMKARAAIAQAKLDEREKTQ